MKFKLSHQLPESLRQEFSEQSYALLCLRVRYTCYFTVGLFMLYYLLDRVMFPEMSETFLYLRLLVAVLHTIVYLLTFTQFGRRHPIALGIFTYVSIGWVIITMCLLSGGHASSYYAGLILVIIGFSIMMPWRLQDALATGLLIAAGYVAAILVLDDVEDLPLFINNNFFLWGTAVIGVITSQLWEGYRRREFLDRVQLREMQTEMVCQQNLASVGTLSAGISHNMNTFAATIDAGLTWLSSVLKKEEMSSQGQRKVQEALRGSKEGLQSIRDMINNLEVFSQKNIEGYKEDDLVRTTKSVIDLAQGKLPSHVELKFSAPPTVSYYFDPHILNPALLNLVSNGVDACEAREKGVIEVFIQLREDDILIGVRDNGLGIPPEIQNRVWDAYFTTKDVDKGTGLGLWMVQRAVVMDHKGRVWFESGETGTTFYISLPQKKGEQDGNREKDTTY